MGIKQEIRFFFVFLETNLRALIRFLMRAQCHTYMKKNNTPLSFRSSTLKDNLPAFNFSKVLSYFFYIFFLKTFKYSRYLKNHFVDFYCSSQKCHISEQLATGEHLKWPQNVLNLAPRVTLSHFSIHCPIMYLLLHYYTCQPAFPLPCALPKPGCK